MYKNKTSIMFIIISLLTSCLFLNSCSKPYDGPSFTVVHYGKET